MKLASCSKSIASAVIAADGGYIVMAGSDSTHTFETTVGGGLASLDHVEAYAVNHCAARRGATDCRILAEGEGGGDRGQRVLRRRPVPRRPARWFVLDHAVAAKRRSLSQH
ncbi:hypothetical protein [Mycobacterium sp. HUMS_1102779]